MPEELRPLDATEERAWRALARFFVIAPRLLDEDLQRGAHMSLSAYTILLHLSEAPGRTLRITELANRAYLSGSRTTRLVDELIAGRLVTKQRNAADGRGFDVTLTEGGLATLQRAYPVHLRSVRARVLDHVDKSALPCFTEVVASIAGALQSPDPPDRRRLSSGPRGGP
jgi:DNA-binding MarR family transcriptional regulator